MTAFPLVELVVHALFNGRPVHPTGQMYVAINVPADLNVAWAIGASVYWHTTSGLTTKTTSHYVGTLSREPDAHNPTIRVVVLGDPIPDASGKAFMYE